MRTVLAAWFEAIGLTDRLGLGAVDELFSGGAAGLLHPTSAVPYPTFRRTVEGWRGWNGYGIGSLEHRMLKEMIVGPELRALQDAVIVPLGKATRPLSTCADAGRSTHPAAYSASLTHRRRARAVTNSSPTAATISRAKSIDSTAAPPVLPNRSRRRRRSTNHVCGGRNPHRAHGRQCPQQPLLLAPAGAPATVDTDIAGGNKLMFRCRRDVGAFFRRHALQDGDVIAVRRLGPRTQLSGAHG